MALTKTQFETNTQSVVYSHDKKITQLGNITQANRVITTGLRELKNMYIFICIFITMVTIQNDRITEMLTNLAQGLTKFEVDYCSRY